MNAPNPEQTAAIEAPGVVFVSAGAGTGKTTVLVERVIDPRTMDVEVDARMRGSIAHQALYKFFSGLP